MAIYRGAFGRIYSFGHAASLHKKPLAWTLWIVPTLHTAQSFNGAAYINAAKATTTSVSRAIEASGRNEGQSLKVTNDLQRKGT